MGRLTTCLFLNWSGAAAVVDVGLVDDDGNDKDLVFEVALGTLKGAVPFFDEESRSALPDRVLRDQRKKK